MVSGLVFRGRWFFRKALLTLKGQRRVALASYPRSGNTWLRSLIEEATNQPTGSVYEDRVMPRGGEGIVIKTHRLDSFQYTHAIYLIRNPFDAIESFYHFKRSVAGVTELDWNGHVEKCVTDWKAHVQHWLKARCPIYRMHYEDLLQDTAGELNSLLLWLGYSIDSEKLSAVVEASRLENLRQKNSGVGQAFFRRGKADLGSQQFTDQQRRYVIEQLQDVLEAAGYGELLQRPG